MTPGFFFFHIEAIDRLCDEKKYMSNFNHRNKTQTLIIFATFFMPCIFD